MRRERIEQRPRPHVAAHRPQTPHPPTPAPPATPRLGAPRVIAPSREILHQAVHDKTLPAPSCRPRRSRGDQRIGEQARPRLMRVKALGLARRGDVEQRIGDRLGREEREALEQAAAFGGQARDRGRPGRGEAGVVVVAHQGLVEPVEHRLALLAPQFQIAREADLLGGDIGAGLFEPEREAAELAGERLGLQPRRRPRRSASLLGALEQEGDRGGLVERAEFEFAQARRKIGDAAGDENLAAPEPRQQLRRPPRRRPRRRRCRGSSTSPDGCRASRARRRF